MKTFFTLILVSGFLISGENSTYLFLRNDVSARATSIGGSFITMKNDPNGIFYNPATINTLSNQKISVGFGKAFLDANYGHFALNFENDNFGNVGVGILFQNYGSMVEIDDNENVLGNFTANELAFVVGSAKNIYNGITLGLNTKFIFSSLSSFQSTAIALDGGILYSIEGANPVTLGISFLNFGTQITKYSETSEELPFDVRAGLTLKPEHLPLELNLNFIRLNESENSLVDKIKYFTIGGEFTLSKTLKFRFGYNNQKRIDLKFGSKSGMAGFSLGGGILIKEYLIDYSYTSLGLLNSISRITITTNF